MVKLKFPFPLGSAFFTIYVGLNDLGSPFQLLKPSCLSP